MQIKAPPALLFLLMIGAFNSYSSPKPQTESTHYSMDKLSINAAAGYLSGESNEYRYNDTGSKLSQLNWTIDGAAIIKGEVNFDFLPWITVNANGWTTLGKGNSALMDDYDWLNPQQSSWTDWSHHPDTNLNYANNIDLNLRAWLLQNQDYKFGAIAGFTRNTFSFLAKGGCYEYNNGADIGCFPNNESMIGYQQQFDAAYLGLAGKYRLNHIELNGALKLSPWVHANDKDVHYARDITFYDAGNNATFSSLTIAAGYYVKPSTKVFFEAAYNQFTNGKADILLDVHNTGIYYFKDAAGLSNNNYVLAFGMQYAPVTL